MQVNSQISFKARIVFVTPKTKIKPYIKPARYQSSKTYLSKTKEPSWLKKLLFGIRKNVKLPTY